MPTTYEPIQSYTLGSAAPSITFSSIPATYTDLRLIFSCTTSGVAGPVFRFNSDTASNYSYTFLYGSASTASSFRQINLTRMDLAVGGAADSTQPSFYTIDIFSYAGSTNKTVLTTGSVDGTANPSIERGAQLWRNTSIINTITLLIIGAGNYNTGTTATLYGIKNA